MNLNEKSVLNGPEVAFCLLNQCRQWVPLCNMIHLFILLLSWQRDQRFSIVLVTLLQLISSVVSCTAVAIPVRADGRQMLTAALTKMETIEA